MKCTVKILAIILVIISFSCEKKDFNELNEISSEITNEEIVFRNSSSSFNTPNYSFYELIVQYVDGLSDADKMNLRQIHGVTSWEICQLCLDETIELWFFELGIQIEPKRKSIETYGGGIIDVDYEFDFEEEIGDVVVGSPDDTSYEVYVTSENTGVTIAVLDTGFDPFFPFCKDEFDNPIQLLYKDEVAEDEVISGWDFVNYDPNAFDDNLGKHGTIVSYEISTILTNDAIPHQILPVKICDSLGMTSYFKFLCGSKFALEKADVIQMSLGWYDDGFGDFENTIYKSLVEEFSDVMIVCSAGNDEKNNDELSHYPSSYSNPNVIAVSAMDASASTMADFSNYGPTSVDFLAVGEEIPFYNYEGELVTGIAGTSFAAPQIAALAAKYIQLNPDLDAILSIGNIVDNGIEVPDDASFYNKVFFNIYYPLLLE